jgi:hypothetical protein
VGSRCQTPQQFAATMPKTRESFAKKEENNGGALSLPAAEPAAAAAAAGRARVDLIRRVVARGFDTPSEPAVASRSNYPFRLRLRLDPNDMPFKFEGKFEPRQEVFVDLTRFDECVPGVYAGVVVDVAVDLGLYEVALNTGFVVLVMEEAVQPKSVENWRKTGISSQLAEGVPVYTSMSGAETYFSAIVQHKARSLLRPVVFIISQSGNHKPQRHTHVKTRHHTLTHAAGGPGPVRVPHHGDVGGEGSVRR